MATVPLGLGVMEWWSDGVMGKRKHTSTPFLLVRRLVKNVQVQGNRSSEE